MMYKILRHAENMQGDGPTTGDDLNNTPPTREEMVRNLMDVEASLQSVLDEHREGTYGFVTREWGFSAPGGLGPRLSGKFRPWEDKLYKARDFFWPVSAYEAMDDRRPFGRPDRDTVRGLPPEGERLYGNTPLHRFLQRPPETSVPLEDSDLVDYRSAAKIFLLLGTLSHLCGNSAPDPQTAEVPSWIEDPLIRAADRLQVEPTLTGHFLVQENWLWRSHHTTAAAAAAPASSADTGRGSSVGGGGMQSYCHTVDRAVAQALFDGCKLDDRRYRFKIYPQCFVGWQAVDVLLDAGYADSREEAVRLGRRINKAFQLFSHVTNDHLLMDKHLFYRFQKKWKVKASISEGIAEVSATDEDQEDGCISPNDDDEANRSRMIRPGDIFGRRNTRSRTGTRTSRNNSTGRSEDLSDKEEDDMNYSEYKYDEKNKTDDGLSRPGPRSTNSNAEGSISDAGSLDGGVGGRSLPEIAAAVSAMESVPVRDRRYRLRVYRRCFVGSQLIDALLERECAASRREALRLALDVNNRFRIVEHVCGDHELKDEYLFYRFTDEFRSIAAPGELTEELPSELNDNSDGARAVRFDDEDGAVIPPTECSSLASTAAYDALHGTEGATEFRFENIDMLYPAFGNNHERVNQLIPACMGYTLRSLPYLVLEILSWMRAVLEVDWDPHAGRGGNDLPRRSERGEGYESRRLADLLHQLAFCLSRCKEQFQLMSTDMTKSTFNSKHVSIRQTQPLSNGVRVRRERFGKPRPSKGTTGTQFPYFHLIDWLLGRHQFGATAASGGGAETGLVGKIAAVDNTFPRPQREYIRALSKLGNTSNLRVFMEAIGCPPKVLSAYNHLLECYAGEGGVLQAHSRKLYSYIHNDVQSSTSGTNHIKNSAQAGGATVCPMSSAHGNHLFAKMMFQHMRSAAEERWRLRIPPLMTEVKKIVYSTSISGGFTTVALDLKDTGMMYDYGDVVKVLLPNDAQTIVAWTNSLCSTTGMEDRFRLEDVLALRKEPLNGWGWPELWEALGWKRFEEGGGKGVPLRLMARYIEQGQILDENGRARWINCPLDLVKGGDFFAFPPTKIAWDRIASLEPVSPRLYSVSGVESDRVFLLVSRPFDGARHHGYERMSDPQIEKVHCSFSPATFFLVPPKGVNLVCVASGTGISPFVGLVDVIGNRQGTYTIAHQCKSSDLFLSNSQNWLDFTAVNPGAVVMGYISGDRSRRNCPMRYIIRNGAFEETALLGRHSSSAYYFQCPLFQGRLKEVYKGSAAVNRAYCCGGVRSAIQPLKDVFEKNGMEYEITCECYGVPATLQNESAACQIGGTVVDLDHVSPIHPGGDQILHQVQDIKQEKDRKTPDHSEAFRQLHPHAYNLHRCLRTPLDADFEAFRAFMERQAMSKSVMMNMASKYTEVALASPNNSKVVRIAAELQSKAIRQNVRSRDIEGAEKSAECLNALLVHIPSQDTDAHRWSKILKDFLESS